MIDLSQFSGKTIHLMTQIPDIGGAYIQVRFTDGTLIRLSSGIATVRVETVRPSISALRRGNALGPLE